LVRYIKSKIHIKGELIMLNKRDICEEIGNSFGEFYVDVSGVLTIDTYVGTYTYDSEDELLKDWLPKLIAEDEETGDGTWADIIEYIQEEIL
jgi:hypothetical protein